MLIKDEHARGGSGMGAMPMLLLILVAGLLLGFWLGQDYRRGQDWEELAQGPFSPEPPAAALLDPGEALRSLPVLEIDIDPAGVAVLTAARARAMREKIISKRPEDRVTGQVSIAAESHPARLRLKGDWTDHVDTDKWSLRIDLEEGSLLGMSRFSIQHPKTRGYLLEWLSLAMARREGILAPRSTFVRVRINGRPSGMYYLEEHFTKEMLESQGRREGPIVRFSEQTLWTHWLQYGIPEGAGSPETVRFAESLEAAEIGGFDEKRMARTAALNQRLQRALGQMRDFQRMKRAAVGSGFGAMQALEELQGRSIDDVFDPRKIGRWLALYCLVNAAHGTNWMQWRFYHDPVLDRLEPIAFDTGAIMLSAELNSLLGSPQVREFLSSDACYEELFESLQRMTSEEYLADLRAEFGSELARFGRALEDEGDTPLAGEGLRDIIFDLLLPSARNLRASISPQVAAHFDCQLLPGGDASEGDVLEIQAWATTWVPIRIAAFEFSNGRSLSAASALPAEASRLRGSDGSVLLARQGRRLRFRVPVDRRLAFLRSVEAVKEGVRRSPEVDQRVRLELKVRYRLAGSDQELLQDLRILRAAPERPDRGRPQSPSLEEALARHPFLAYDLERDRLSIRPGSWQVEGDLVIPAGHRLHAYEGTSLFFAEGAVLSSSSALEFVGREDEPITLAAQEGQRSWAGLIVHGAVQASQLRHVRIRNAAGVDRGSWQSPGAVTFYHSPVHMVDTGLENSLAEDALNVFGADMSMTRVSFLGGRSDLFDGDFVSGFVRDCTFSDSGGDAIDLSGSRLEIEGCSFQDIGDKALSVGEDSRVEARRCRIEGAAIGLAAKDSSQLDMDGLQVGSIENFAFAAYIKKSEYGPASMQVKGLELLGGQAASALVQTGCSVRIEGDELPTVEVDVADLYRRRILGK
ncbi:MAG: CotH kinase family protein [Planctomycetota bacterium]|jgi:hypothetical protein